METRLEILKTEFTDDVLHVTMLVVRPVEYVDVTVSIK